jgi:hypothetical protein
VIAFFPLSFQLYTGRTRPWMAIVPVEKHKSTWQHLTGFFQMAAASKKLTGRNEAEASGCLLRSSFRGKL